MVAKRITNSNRFRTSRFHSKKVMADVLKVKPRGKSQRLASDLKVGSFLYGQ
jgi:hypothetical protein